MLEKFVIEQNVVDMEHTDSARDKKLAIIRFMETWERYGILVTTNNAVKEVLETLQSSPSAIEKLKTITKGQIFFKDSEDFDGYFCCGTPCSNYSQYSSLALVNDVTAIELGLDDEADFTVNVDELEISPIHHFSDSKTILDIRDRHAATVTKGSNTEDVWKSLFSPLESSFKKWVVVDRYAGKNAFDTSRMSGLEKLVRKLNSGSRPHTLEIFTTIPDDRSATELMNWIQFHSSPNSQLNNVILHVVADTVFSQEAHDRYIRHEHFVTYIGVGLALLSGNSTRQNISVNFTLSSVNFMSALAIEKSLRNSAATEKLKFS